ncbi:MAG: ABC transporter substrate-binding protein [Chloroflexota bacterium]
MPRRYQRCVSFAGIILFASFAGCRGPASERPPGYLVVGIESNPLQIDPRYATDANSVRIGNLIYNSLLRADTQGRLQPELAEDWRQLDDRTYLFSLRNGVRFHDGKPLTAADVKFTYESILNPRNQSPLSGALKPLQSVEQTASHQLRFHLSAVHAPFIEQFSLGIVPFGSKGAAGGDLRPPLGSGPFAVETIDSGEKVTLKANPDYWEGRPALPGIVFKIVPDAMVRALEFKKGAIDFMQNDIEPDMLPWLKNNSASNIETHQGTTFQYIGMNLTHPILRLRKVRQALAYAIDRGALIRHLLKNTATEADSVLSPLNWAYAEGLPRWRYDPGRAKRLLDEAGFPDPDGDGPLPRFRLSFKTTNIDLRRRIAEALKEQLQRVGIELEVRSYEWATFFSDVKNGNFHLYSLAWVGIQDPDILYQLFHSDSVPPNGDNRGRYSNPAVDRLLERGRKTVNRTERRAIYREVQIILAEDLPYLPLWWWKNVIVRKPGLRGFVAYPDGELISLKKTSLG